MIRQRFLVCNVIKQVGNISMKNNGNVAVQIAHKEREREKENLCFCRKMISL